MAGKVSAFGPFKFDFAGKTLWRDDTAVPLGARAAVLLAVLLEADGKVVGKSELIEAAWPGVFVEEGNLAVQIAGLRKTLGTRADGSEWIATVPRTGYRFATDVPAAPNRPSIAILPFVNMSSDPEQDYFADGMVEDLTTAMSRFRNISVIARQSTFAYKHRPIDIRDVARDLGVRYLLEGSVRREGRQIRVNAQLIEGASGAHLWAVKLDGDLDKVFDFHDRITESVVGLIEPQIQKAEFERTRRKRPENMDAYDLYLQALPSIVTLGVPERPGYNKSLDLLDKAIALDPKFAAALAAAAWIHEKRYTGKLSHPPGVDDAALAIERSSRALIIDANDPLVVLVAGVVRMTISGDSDGGLELIRRAETLNPGSTLILNTLSYAQHFRGEYDAAVATSMRALTIARNDPVAYWSHTGLARSHLAAGRIEEAMVWAQRALDAPPRTFAPFCVLAACYASLGKVEEGRETIRKAQSIWPGLTIVHALGRDARPEGRDRQFVEGLRAVGLPD